MLAHKYDASRLTFPCFTQPKLNGIRALYQNGRFYSRDEIQWAPGVLAHLASQLSAYINPSYHPLDGELYLHGLSLQKINSAVSINQTSPGPKTPQIEYHVFDVVNFSQPFWARYQQIYSLLQSTSSHSQIRPVPTRLISSLGEANEFYNADLRAGYEGSMYRLDGKVYTKPHEQADQKNRTFNLLKRKDWHDDKFLIVGITEGRDTDKGGKYVGCMGALVCILPDGSTFNVGSGFSDKERKEWFVNPPLQKYAHVKYLTLSDDGKPQNGTFLVLCDHP